MAQANLEFHPDAAWEITEATRWYAERSMSAADGFVSELNDAVAALVADPHRFAAYLHGTRRVRVHRYPYLVVYVFDDARIRIVAVAHTSRRPGYWSERRFDAEDS